VMMPYPCWDPSASAVKIRKVASCIALPLIRPLYTDELTVSRQWDPMRVDGPPYW
jgi:hypothetical protein